MSESRTTVPGSNRPEIAAGEVTGPVDPGTPVEITLVLRRRAEPPAEAFGGPPLTRAQLAEGYGGDPADLDAVRAAVTAAGAEIVSADLATRLVRVRGPVGRLSELFGTSLHQAAPGVGGTRRRGGELTVPPALAGVLVGVLGLDDRPQAEGRFRIAGPNAAPGSSFTPVQLAAAYNFPAGDGAGQTIAIIELGGGFGPSDLTSYFGGLGLPVPSVTAVSVDGAQNAAGQDPQGADGEVLLDIEVAGAVAPAAKQLVYFAPNTDAGFVDAITQAAHAALAPTAMSISWGQSEDQWSAQSRTAMDNAMADAVLLGVTVTAAAGDSGSSDSTSSTPGAHVDFPASSPHALACGGTSLQVGSGGAVTSESVWNDGPGGGATGGGVSDTFPVPAWQAGAGVPARAGGGSGRGVPDVAGDADPQTGYQVLVDGQATVIGGTSAVSPLWAGLVCRLAQSLGRPLGLLQPAIYAAAAPGTSPAGFRDITQGGNGAYSAAPGWDPCTGVGVPDGQALLAALRSAAPNTAPPPAAATG
ncbi:MAG TPA: S53 family peptidase [Jatrophihabitans sp.]|jgi:kumamolisin|uniref:S53 family peptidase n=1 Tax=Jatrophihabitans sp. TaxID=1932789 RepID=UPI002DF914D2|nr:S53 family peptidase [Jatrophihabitans sp.]